MNSSADARAIVFIGPMGAGKTSIGRRVARALHLPFVDTDRVIVRDHGPIPEIFTIQGEPRFRALEREAVAESLGHGGVISLGGGAVLDADTRAALAPHRVVYLTVSPETVASRIRDANRPLVAGDDPVGAWERIYAERRPLYEEVADVTFDTSSGPITHVATAVLDWLKADE
ncbi:Shikimate kinase [Microbacterium sp. C448]|uniref:shikimate kinase n=1 Tax=Microbacterium TaxID=33882 RepID=UPI0003DE0A89|nr:MULTISPECIES: shikimate kinase [Microbacterium]MDO8382356.1 shikimate kinase [Microbacterium sp.]CDK00831.1 Shikimate kinase [Microbacterium sp. C448]|tara:strand:- start:1847 stop:2365 length:519 start_codon:yes stop_codon:yes gene_type:complete